MTSLVKCDNCGKQADLVMLDDAFGAWYTVESGPSPVLHFHSLACLREWFSPEAIAVRVEALKDGT